MAISTLPTVPNIIEPEAEKRRALVLLAREIARSVDLQENVLARKGITEAQYEKILKNPFYAKTLEAEIDSWNAPQNAETRNRVQAAWILENAWPAFHVRLHNPNEPLRDVTAGLLALAKIAGIGEKGDALAAGTKFSININLGRGHEIKQIVNPFEIPPGQIEGTVNPPTEEPPNGDAQTK